MARIPPVDPASLPDSYEKVEENADRLHDAITAEWWNDQATVQTFGNIPELADAHVNMNVSMWTETGLSPAEVEYVILTVARTIDAPYVWHDHSIAALERAGLHKPDLLAISRMETSELPDTEGALVEYVAEFGETGGDVSDGTHDSLTEFYDDDQVVGIAMLAAYYVFLDHASTALGLEPDEEFLGWELENY